MAAAGRGPSAQEQRWRGLIGFTGDALTAANAVGSLPADGTAGMVEGAAQIQAVVTKVGALGLDGLFPAQLAAVLGGESGLNDGQKLAIARRVAWVIAEQFGATVGAGGNLPAITDEQKDAIQRVVGADDFWRDSVAGQGDAPAYGDFSNALEVPAPDAAAPEDGAGPEPEVGAAAPEDGADAGPEPGGVRAPGRVALDDMRRVAAAAVVAPAGPEADADGVQEEDAPLLGADELLARDYQVRHGVRTALLTEAEQAELRGTVEREGLGDSFLLRLGEMMTEGGDARHNWKVKEVAIGGAVDAMKTGEASIGVLINAAQTAVGRFHTEYAGAWTRGYGRGSTTYGSTELARLAGLGRIRLQRMGQSVGPDVGVADDELPLVDVANAIVERAGTPREVLTQYYAAVRALGGPAVTRTGRVLEGLLRDPQVKAQPSATVAMQVLRNKWQDVVLAADGGQDALAAVQTREARALKAIGVLLLRRGAHKSGVLGFNKVWFLKRLGKALEVAAKHLTTLGSQEIEGIMGAAQDVTTVAGAKTFLTNLQSHARPSLVVVGSAGMQRPAVAPATLLTAACADTGCALLAGGRGENLVAAHLGPRGRLVNVSANTVVASRASRVTQDDLVKMMQLYTSVVERQGSAAGKPLSVSGMGDAKQVLMAFKEYVAQQGAGKPVMKLKMTAALDKAFNQLPQADKHTLAENLDRGAAQAAERRAVGSAAPAAAMARDPEGADDAPAPGG